MNIVVDSTQDPAWNVTGGLADFGEWLTILLVVQRWAIPSTYDEEILPFDDLDDDMESILIS